MKEKYLRNAAFAALSILLALIAWEMGFQRFAIGATRWIVIGFCGGLGLTIGWLFSPHAKSLRRVFMWGALALLMLMAFTANRHVGDGLASFLSCVAFTMGFGYWLGSAAKGFLEKPVTFGSAEWATADYLRDNDLVGDDGLRLGAFPDKEASLPVQYAGDRHLLTVAPTRSGKGVAAIIPNLLTYRGSVLVIDPKGENALITAKARAAMGQDIHIVDPWGIARDAGAASRFNPLDWLDAGDLDITENAMLLADALVVPDEGGDRFWIEEAKALLQGLILYVATDEHEADNRHLGRVRDLLLLDGEEMPQLFWRMANSMHHVVASTGTRSLQKEEKLLANVIASAQAQTHFLDSPRLRESLSASDFKFEDLKSKPTTIYLTLPADRLTAFGRWLRLLIQQAITVNARDIATKPAKPVLFILDEMPALGRLAMVEQAFGLMAGFGMQLWGIVQDLGQLKRIYGDAYEGFIANAGAVSYFGSRDRMTADYFSALCGVTTVWNLSSAISRAFSSGQGGGSNSSSTSENTSAVQRKLAFPDELMRLPAHKQLVFIENHHPISAVKVRWYQDPALMHLGRNLLLGDGA